MCGIAGLWDTNGTTRPEQLRGLVAAMTATLRHRGPDADGFWQEACVGLGQRRLAIIDLSPAGNQPMTSACGRFVVTYNGECYNAAELRAELETRGHRFRGHSDTEVLVEGFSCFGVEEMVGRFNGMFPFAVWDRAERRLVLARDRLGIKPLYWAMQDGVLLFGSELKALRAHPAFRPDVDRDAVAAFLRHNYVPAPLTVYRGAAKLRPGHILVVCADGRIEERCYWNARDIMLEGMAHRGSSTDDEMVDRLESLLTDAVHRQMVADVPLGAFLSGGIDSSTVVALMCKKAGARVRSFSIGFHEKDYDESGPAAAVAAHLGTDHTELVVNSAQALDLIPRLSDHWDEPFADSSQIPTLLLAQLTRTQVKVALSGDGGDELFAGYNRYLWWQRLKRLTGWVPPIARDRLAGIVNAVPLVWWDRLSSVAPARLWPPQLGDKARKFAELIKLDEVALYRSLVSHWPDPERLVPSAQEPQGPLWDAGLVQVFPDAVERMQFLDTITYLPDDILTKVDRASMAVSLEARVPLLDHRVVEFAWTLPKHGKLRGTQGKWALRQVLYRHVPKALVERPKMGFGVPIHSWLRGPLRAWAESLLDASRLRVGGLIDPGPVRRVWQEHLSGQRNWQFLLWDVLMLEAWRERWNRPA
jgi:asparagine synthase (glutamine-hydrolysing)